MTPLPPPTETPVLTSKRLVDIIPAKARQIIYVLFSFLALAFIVVWSAIKDGLQPEDIPLIITGLLSAAGFQMAASNTRT